MSWLRSAPWLSPFDDLAALRRGRMASYDIAVRLPLGVDPEPYTRVGAMWWLTEWEPDVPLDTVRGVLRDGPAA
ncbi:MAG: hypothetical protein ACJ736_32760 [Streptomyces sp.]